MSVKRAEKQKRKEKEKRKRKAQAITSEILAQHYAMAEWSAYRDEPRAAVSHIKKILTIRPDDKGALLFMADAQYRLKNYAMAAYYYERAKRMGENPPMLEYCLGLSYFWGDIKPERALENFEEFIEKTKPGENKEMEKLREYAVQYRNLLITRLMFRESAPAGGGTVHTKAPVYTKDSKGTREAREKPAEAIPAQGQSPAPEDDYRIDVHFSFSPPDPILERIREHRTEEKSLYDLRLEFHHLSLLRGYDELLCLDTLRNVDRYWYQIETVKRVLKHYRGRVLLADEVGLGKTIEACMLIKEYLLRGMVKRVLVLTPTSLVSQWREELSGKFGLDFATTDDEGSRTNGTFWPDHPLIIASINLAKSRRNFENITQVEHDLVVVDEAHHMRNSSTLNWKLVNALKKRFIFLISATPVQNNLIELFNLITLLKPGFLKTQAEFRKRYVAPGKPKMPQNSDALRDLLREVMIRNTRSLIDVKLPPRFAATITVSPSPPEREIYDRISSLVREWFAGETLDWFTLTNLQMRAGSSIEALTEALEKMGEKKGDGVRNKAAEIIRMLPLPERSEKKTRLLALIRKKPGEKKIVFAHYLRTLDSLADLLTREGISFTVFRGGMTTRQKDEAIDDFRERQEVLLSTEVGGEGRNIQFCRTIINYDLPWNPMRIEQRIGRIHRIGQTNDVFIFNFCQKGSIEEYILDILDRKINMFELVIGEIDNILGNLDEEREFSDIVMDIWARSLTKEELEGSFERLGEWMVEAKKKYQESKRLDESILAADYAV